MRERLQPPFRTRISAQGCLRGYICVVCLSMVRILTAGDVEWRALPPIPDRLGLAGAYAGIANGQLLVAGGANFPNGPPWEGGQKVWHDDVYALERSDGTWRSVGKLPQGLAYGVSATYRDGLICVGGSHRTSHIAQVFRLELAKDQLRLLTLPSLPVPLANASGGLVGDTLIVAGGQQQPNSLAVRGVYALDLSAPKGNWRKLPDLPGHGCILATAAVIDNTFWLIGGAELIEREGKLERRYLREVLQLKPTGQWQRRADLPQPCVAAPAPAPIHAGEIYLLGGDDGSQVSADPRQHQGFAATIVTYHPKIDRWSSAGKLPSPTVTAPVVNWQGRWVIVSGETKPGVRSPQVISLGWK